MKNIVKTILAVAAAGAVFASCSKLNQPPTFDAKESYAAFSKATYSVNEDCGTITIPVTIASYKEVESLVSYTILGKGDDDKYTAIVGPVEEGRWDVKDTNEDGVLVFDGTTRTANIVLEINSHVGDFTGDLKFAVEINTASNLKVGGDNKVEVTIADLDHPLANILGSYTAVSDLAGDITTWTLTLTKDSEALDVVHIDYITAGCQALSSWGDWSYVGKVSEDKKTITISCGQRCQAWYKTVTDVFELYSFTVFDGSSISGLSNKGSVDATLDDSGVWHLKNIWLRPVETLSWYIDFAIGETTWTKQ